MCLRSRCTRLAAPDHRRIARCLSFALGVAQILKLLVLPIAELPTEYVAQKLAVWQEMVRISAFDRLT